MVKYDDYWFSMTELVFCGDCANGQALLLARIELISKVGLVLCDRCRSGSCWLFKWSRASGGVAG